MHGIDRYWFLTWTMYGQWLPGDPRGSVTRIEQPDRSHRDELDEFGTPYIEGIPALYESARESLKGEPLLLTQQQADLLLPQFQETSDVRKWFLVGTAIMANHVHIIVGVPGDPDPETLLRDFKAYGSRKLNRSFGKPESGTWWTESGSKRKLSNNFAIRNAFQYLRDQEYPLLIWINPIAEAWNL